MQSFGRSKPGNEGSEVKSLVAEYVQLAGRFNSCQTYQTAHGSPFQINVNESQLNKLAKTGLVDRISPFIWGVIFPIIILAIYSPRTNHHPAGVDRSHCASAIISPEPPWYPQLLPAPQFQPPVVQGEPSRGMVETSAKLELSEAGDFWQRLIGSLGIFQSGSKAMLGAKDPTKLSFPAGFRCYVLSLVDICLYIYIYIHVYIYIDSPLEAFHLRRPTNHHFTVGYRQKHS